MVTQILFTGQHFLLFGRHGPTLMQHGIDHGQAWSHIPALLSTWSHIPSERSEQQPDMVTMSWVQVSVVTYSLEMVTSHNSFGQNLLRCTLAVVKDILTMVTHPLRSVRFSCSLVGEVTSTLSMVLPCQTLVTITCSVVLSRSHAGLECVMCGPGGLDSLTNGHLSCMQWSKNPVLLSCWSRLP